MMEMAKRKADVAVESLKQQLNQKVSTLFIVDLIVSVSANSSGFSFQITENAELTKICDHLIQIKNS